MKQRNNRTAFLDWTGNRDIASLGTNAGAQSLPFQDWRRIKEAFAPELIDRAIQESPTMVQRCIDPFGGSGTTGLACQFLGVHPIVAEVNPYLADLIEAKLASYPAAKTLTRELAKVIEASVRNAQTDPRALFASAPATFVEPGHNGRWIFDAKVADRIVALRDAINEVEDPARRLFRVLLGGILIEVSNVTISGKGRRYRRRWRERLIPPDHVTQMFSVAAQRAIGDISRFGRRSVTSYEILRGDSRAILHGIEPCQIAVFSPPYPNSADYTDIYNVELWSLGYLSEPKDNASLRLATLSSHVQRSREYPEAPTGSATLKEILAKLDSRRTELWDQNIPLMVGAYFHDLIDVLDALGLILEPGGTAWIVVGDSRYAGVQVHVAQVIQELVQERLWEILFVEPFRSMPTSAQQGGERMLAEQLVVLRNAR